jgi:hypothetical protein
MGILIPWRFGRWAGVRLRVDNGRVMTHSVGLLRESYLLSLGPMVQELVYVVDVESLTLSMIRVNSL